MSSRQAYWWLFVTAVVCSIPLGACALLAARDGERWWTLYFAVLWGFNISTARHALRKAEAASD
jgi:hypothetical protein